MSDNKQNHEKRTGAGLMEYVKLLFVVGGFLVLWVLLQRVILPKLGVQT
jgi:hypothetical protein